jgi:hypothetical protein
MSFLCGNGWGHYRKGLSSKICWRGNVGFFFLQFDFWYTSHFLA